MLKKPTKSSLRRLGVSILLGLGFFVLWAVLISLVMSNDTLENPPWTRADEALQRLWWEVVPALALLVATGVFASKIGGKIGWPVLAGNKWVKNLAIGTLVGVGWLAVVVLPLVLMGFLQFEGTTTVASLTIWFAAMVINVVMQEYLVRGYLFTMIEKRHSVAAAAIVTTILFTLMHGLQGGVLGVANVVAASLVFTFLLIRTGSLLAPIVAHIIWNGIGGVILGVVSLGGVYPSLLKVSQHGSDIMTGGAAVIEGSIVTLFVSAMIVLGLWLVGRKPRQATRKAVAS